MATQFGQPAADTINAESSVPQDTEKHLAGKAVSHNNNDKPITSLREDVAAAGLSKVYERHGRVDLEPMPSDDPEDPLNWRPWRKNVLLGLVAFHTLMGPGGAAAIIPAFMVLSADFGISITQVSYFVSSRLPAH